MIRLDVDTDADAAYLALSDAVAAATVDHGAFAADYDADGRLVGIEIHTLHRDGGA